MEENKQHTEKEHLYTEELLAKGTFQLSPQLGWPTSGGPEPAQILSYVARFSQAAPLSAKLWSLGQLSIPCKVTYRNHSVTTY